MLTFKHSIGPDVRLTFSDKPDARIRSMLKANGFRWSSQNGFWWRSRIAGAADFIGALDRAIGPRRPDGACWMCGAPEGYFRNEGAATPVRCDECHKAHREQTARTSRRHHDDPIGADLAYEDQCRAACGL